MSLRNHSQSLQNDSGKLNLVVHDEGTSNIYANTKTLRIEPQGSLRFGPAAREVTINTAFNTGGSIIVPGDILWEVGSAPGTNNIQAKNSGGSTATGTQAVSHGDNNDADGDYSYTGGGSGNTVEAGATGSVILGGSSNSVATGITRTAVIGGAGITGDRASSLFIGTGGITRASTGAVWEDGNCGNSEQLWFTPTEFMALGDLGRGLVGIPMGITDTSGISPATLSGAGSGPGAYHQGGEESQMVAMKLLPKGFQTVEEEPIAYFYFASVGAPAWVSRLQVLTTDLNTNTYTAISLSTAPSGSPSEVLLTSPVIGMGRTTIVVIIDQSEVISAREALLGVSVPIMRV